MQAAGTTGSAIIRHSLRDGLRLIRDLPGAPGFLATIIRAKQSFVANLTSASGCQDHTTSPSTSNALVTHAIRVHRIPAPRIRDDRPKRPSSPRRDDDKQPYFLEKRKKKICAAAPDDADRVDASCKMSFSAQALMRTFDRGGPA